MRRANAIDRIQFGLEVFVLGLGAAMAVWSGSELLVGFLTRTPA